MAEFKKFSELSENKNEKTVLLLLEKSTQTTKNGGTYVDCRVSDGETIVEKVKIWNSTAEEFEIEPKSLFSAIIFTKPYNGQRSYEIAKYDDPPGDARLEDFIKTAPFKPEDMFGWITGQLAKFGKRPDGTDGVAVLAINLYNRFKERILYWPAAMSKHHNIHGGLLYHTFMMMRSALQVGPIYKMDMEVLLAGIALHDIGKLYELDSDEFGIADYTVNGNLFGHLFIGARLVGEAAKDGKYDLEQVRMVEHIIVSHHGNRNWGAITLPATREALLVSRLDEFDAKLYQYDEALRSVEPGGQSDRIYDIGGVVVKPGYDPGSET